MPYATPDDLILRKDERTLAMLSSDTSVPTPIVNLPTNQKLLTALSGASGKINAAILKGGRYTKAQLDALTGDDRELLVSICCHIAFWELWKRKTYTNKRSQDRQFAWEEQREWLTALKTGEEIFAIDEVIAAGHPNVQEIGLIESQDLNLVADKCRGRGVFPKRRTYKNR